MPRQVSGLSFYGLYSDPAVRAALARETGAAAGGGAAGEGGESGPLAKALHALAWGTFAFHAEARGGGGVPAPRLVPRV